MYGANNLTGLSYFLKVLIYRLSTVVKTTWIIYFFCPTEQSGYPGSTSNTRD